MSEGQPTPGMDPSTGPELPSHKRSAEDANLDYTNAKKAKTTEKKASPGKDVGIVKWFDINKSFGFITRETGDDVFVHQSNIRVQAPGRKGLADGETVEFGVEIQNGKMRAMEVAGVGGGPVVGQPDPMAVQFGSSAPAVLPPHNADPLGPGRMRGKCKWFNPTKGFGFIIPADGSPEVFVHQSDLKSDRRQNRSIAEEENVEFTLELDPSNKKRKALDVTGPGGAFVVGQPLQPAVGGGLDAYGGYGAASYGSYATPVAYAQPAAYSASPAASPSDQWAAYQAAYAQYAAAAAAAGTPVVPPAQAPAEASAGAYPQYTQYPPAQQYPQYTYPPQ